MANFAVIEDGIVVNVIVAESAEIASDVTKKLCVQYDENIDRVQRGWQYDGSNFINILPQIITDLNVE